MHVCWDTVKKWRREYDCPVYTSPGRPTALAGELDQWLIVGSREREGKGRGEGYPWLRLKTSRLWRRENGQ